MTNGIRLERTRWPNQLPGLGWSYGMPLDYLRELVDYWADGFDWSTQEARLNAVPNYRIEINGLEIHFIHVPGRGPRPRPLLLLHGYPSTPFGCLELISHLTDPAAHRGTLPMPSAW